MAKTIEEKLTILANRLDRVENDLDKKIKILLNTSETKNSFYSTLQRQITMDYDEAKVIYAEWNKIVIPPEYNKNIAKQIKRIKDKKYYKPPVKLNTKKFLNTDKNKQTIAGIVNDSISVYFAGLDMGQKAVFQMLRATQQSNIAEAEINRLISEGFFQKGSSYGAKKNLLTAFEKVVDGKYIKIIDKNGNPIQYHLKTYADLVARVKLSEAQALGTVRTAMAYKTDLIAVSAHNTITAICLPYEGKIFSLTGSTPEFPIIDTLTPFHVNCLHSISVVFEEALKINGTFDQYKSFSNGETFVHPTRKSFIPTNDLTARVKNYDRAHKITADSKKVKKQVSTIKKQLAKIASK